MFLKYYLGNIADKKYCLVHSSPLNTPDYCSILAELLVVEAPLKEPNMNEDEFLNKHNLQPSRMKKL